MLGDCDHYFSPYIFGVQQGMSRLGHLHSQVNIRAGVDIIAKRIADVRPDILWTHMLLWGPPGSPPVAQLLDIVRSAKKNGARVVVHDGDYKQTTRHPHDLSSWCALALCNHTFDRSAWRVPTLRWPYFAFAQDKIADAAPEWSCDLFFAGITSQSTTYAARSALLEDVRRRGVKLRMPTPADGNTLFRTPEIAASAGAVLGFGRPGVDGWVDTRVFQYPGSGAVLLHDDAAGYLTPGEHFLPYQSGDAASIAEALGRLRRMPERDRRALRERGFAHVQANHSSVARVAQVLRTLEIA